ncbi:MAG: SdrD B-like domain-containing protein [Gemmatimonadaceae bacterium]|nr:SdrD B-like domain-containing protein [Gemmatimonadaceae bacterium]
MNQRACVNDGRSRAPCLSVRTRLGLTLLLTAVAVSGGASTAHAAGFWPNESAMRNDPDTRSTFIADPGIGELWSRGELIADHGQYYRDRGFGNVLWWGEMQATFDAGGRTWAGCETLSGTQISPATPCADATADWADWTAVANGLTDPRIHALVNNGAFIALVCGNFSQGLNPPTHAPSISGTKFEDLNGDGDRDPGEPGLANWTIQLFNGGALLATDTTDPNGHYAFELDADTYRITSENFEVREVLQANWVQSRAPAQIRVPYGSGNADFGANDFGNYRPATITGIKFHDANADGAQDSDEPGLPDWQISLSNGATRTTAADGTYAFSGLRPSDLPYTVSETQRDGYRQTAPAPVGGTHSVTLQSGQIAGPLAFGNVCLGSSSVTVRDTSTGQTVAGAEVRIEEIDVSDDVITNDPALPRTSTDGTFGGLLPGGYRVIVFLPAGQYSIDPDTQVVDGRWATVKEITVVACQDTELNVDTFSQSDGKVTGGMKNLPASFATAGFQFQTGPKGDPRGTLQYNDHAAGGPKLHANQIDAIHVSDDRTEAYIWGTVTYEGQTLPFRLHLVDLGEPGTLDRFELDVLDAYQAGHGIEIIGGNVQIHK